MFSKYRDLISKHWNAALALAAFGMAATAAPAQAALVFDIEQVGTSVEFNYSGEVNTSELTQNSYYGGAGGAVIYGFVLGAGSSDFSDAYSVPGIDLSSLFSNTSIGVGADSDTGPGFSVNSNVPAVYVPTAYVSGTTISGESSFLKSTIASLGLKAGASYTYDYGAGTGADSITFNVSAVSSAVPESSTWAMMLAGFAGLGFVARRQRARRQRAQRSATAAA